MRLLQGLILILGIFGITSSSWSHAEVVRIAVSTTINEPIEKICQQFTKNTDYGCKITYAPTGHLYAHVMHGMAYDLFLSSDETYTSALINAKLANPNSRFLVAKGLVVLWSADSKLNSQELYEALTNDSNLMIAIANPSSSSYGGAAKEVLQGYHLWNRIQDRLVFANNVRQTYEMVSTQKSPIGFISLSQLPALARDNQAYWLPDPKTYKPVAYEMVTLKTLNNAKATEAFVTFLKAESSCQTLREHGFTC